MATRNRRNDNIFNQLKKVFSTGLVVSDIKNEKIKVIDTQRTQAYTRKQTLFSKLHKNQIYQASLAQNYSINRLALYRDYDMMDADPILSSALDIYVFQALTKDEYGDILQISGDDEEIVDILRQLFYQRLNCQFNFNVWFRNLVKYGDAFIALRLDDELGIIGCQPISPYDLQRQQNQDDNPQNYYFKFTAGGGQKIDNYNIAHFRLLTDTNFLPYGRSTLEPARRIWKNLSLMIDAMMIQRIMRAPERRVFKIDVGDLSNEEVTPFMKDVIDKMKKVPYKDPQTGQINLKYNMQNILEDFFIPVRGKEDGSTVQTLSGMENPFTEDIKFILSYMFAALKIPKAFLTFEEGIEAKATLASLDIVFSRLIERLQDMFLNELYRVALIHLFILGYTDLEDVNFKLALNNPSNVKQIQQVELWNQKVDLGIKMEESGQFSMNFIYDHIYEISPDEAITMLKQIKSDKKYKGTLERIFAQNSEPEQQGGQQGFGEEDEYGQDIGEDEDQESPDTQEESTKYSKPQIVKAPETAKQIQKTIKPLIGQDKNPMSTSFRGNSPLNID